MDGSEFVIAEDLVEREVVRLASFAPRLRSVADHRHSGFEESDGAVPRDLRVGVPHEVAEDEQGFVAGFAQEGPLRIAEEFLPARQILVGEFAEFVRGHFLPLGGGLPGQPAHARFGREEEFVGQDFGSESDHGTALTVEHESANTVYNSIYAISRVGSRRVGRIFGDFGGVWGRG